MLGPRKADGGLPQPTFLKLVQDSHLVDSGVDVGIAFEGRAPDIGPFEHGATSGGDSPVGDNSGSSGGCFIELLLFP